MNGNNERRLIAGVLEAHQIEYVDAEVGYDCDCDWQGTLHLLTLSGALRHQGDAVLAALDLPARDARVRAEALAPVWAVVDEWESMAGESDRVGTIGGDAAARNFRRLADQLRTAIEGGSGE